MNELRPLTPQERDAYPDADASAMIVVGVRVDGAPATILVDERGVTVEMDEGGWWWTSAVKSRETHEAMAKVLPPRMDSALLARIGFVEHS